MKRTSPNHLLAILVAFFSFFTVKGFAQPQFIIGNVPNANSAIITIPITSNNFIQFLGIQGSINWDNTKLTYNSVANLNSQLAGTTFGNSVSGSIGRLTYAWTDNALVAQTIPNGTVLFNLRLNLIPTATGVTSVSFSNTPTPLLVADVNLSTVTGVVYTPGTVTIPWALPVKISSFTANKNTNTVTLNWATSEEKNVAHYLVERSTNGTDFVATGNVAASGLNIAKQYTYTDALNVNSSKVIYYRIKIVDNDGRFTYSKIVSIKNDDKSTILLVYPNPVKESLSVQISSSKAEIATVQVTDLLGRILIQQQVQLQIGSTSIPLNVANLKKGEYIVLIKGMAVSANQQFIKD